MWQSLSITFHTIFLPASLKFSTIYDYTDIKDINKVRPTPTHKEQLQNACQAANINKNTTRHKA